MAASFRPKESSTPTSTPTSTPASAPVVVGDEKRTTTGRTHVVVEEKKPRFKRMTVAEAEEKKPRFKRVTVAEAKESKPYWDLVGYRHERIAHVQLVGLRLIMEYLRHLPQLQKNSGETKSTSRHAGTTLLLLYHFFVTHWLLSPRKFKQNFTLEKSISHLNRISEIKDLHPADKLAKLHRGISRLHQIAKKDIPAGYSIEFMYDYDEKDEKSNMSKMQPGRLYICLQGDKLVCHVLEDEGVKTIKLQSLSATVVTSIMDDAYNLVDISPGNAKAVFDAISKEGYDLLPERLTQRFMQEPSDDTDRELDSHIRGGEWTRLNYSHPDFLRRLTQALRLERITTDDYATAEFLHAGYQFFGCVPEQFSYADARGPFRPEAYFPELKPTFIADFKKQAKKLPRSQQCYFTFKMSRKLMVLYLYFSVGNGANLEAKPSLLGENADIAFAFGSQDYYPKLPIYKKLLADILEEYIKNQRLQHAEDNFEAAALLIGKLRDPDQLILVKDYDAVYKIISHYEYQNEAMKNFLTGNELSPDQKQLRDSLQELHLGIRSSERTVFVFFSNGFLQMAVPSTASLNLLLKIIFPNNAISSKYMLGHLTTRKMKEVQQGSMKRGASLMHPDVIPPQRPHELDMNEFIIQRHDSVHHLYGESNFLCRRLISYAVQLLVSTKQHEMDPAIWEFVDCDYGMVFVYSDYALLTAELKLEYLKRMLQEVLFRTYVTKSDYFRMDASLIFLFDIVKNRGKWERLAGEEVVNRVLSNWQNRSPKNLAQAIHDRYPNKSTLFKIVAYRLQDAIANSSMLDDEKQRDERWRFLDFVDRHLQIQQYFNWVKPDTQHLHFNARCYDHNYPKPTAKAYLDKKFEDQYRITNKESAFIFEYIQFAVAADLQQQLKTGLPQEKIKILMLIMNSLEYFSKEADRIAYLQKYDPVLLSECVNGIFHRHRGKPGIGPCAHITELHIQLHLLSEAVRAASLLPVPSSMPGGEYKSAAPIVTTTTTTTVAVTTGVVPDDSKRSSVSDANTVLLVTNSLPTETPSTITAPPVHPAIPKKAKPSFKKAKQLMLLGSPLLVISSPPSQKNTRKPG